MTVARSHYKISAPSLWRYTIVEAKEDNCITTDRGKRRMVESESERMAEDRLVRGFQRKRPAARGIGLVLARKNLFKH